MNFLAQETAGWGGGSSTRRGGGQKVRALRLEVSLLEGRNLGCSRNFVGMFRTPVGVQTG